MGRIGACAIALAFAATGPGPAAERVTLREVGRAGDATRATVELKAEGTFRPATPPGSPEPKPLALKVETRVEFDDRVAEVGRAGAPSKSARAVGRAGATINGEVRPSASAIRPEVAALVAAIKGDSVEVASLGGPLTRAELELVQGPGDPLALPSLLPTGPVAVGDRWAVGDLAARNLSGYDALAANSLEATLESVDDDRARVRLLGSIRGAALGGEGSMACDGGFSFDRKANRVDHLTLRRAETRRPGPVEAGLDVKSVLTVARVAATAAGTAVDAATLATTPGRELLLFNAPDGKFSLIHDRDWHLYWDDARQVVLKRLDRGELVAQCNITDGPNAGKGRHQDPTQFRDDIRKALGGRFVRVVGQGEVDGVPDAGYRFKVTVEGRQGDAGVLWHYYLIAGPDGDQLIATFTLGMAQQAQFADQDLRLIGTLEWKK